jgi:flagellar basal-body rod protein FlgC
MRVGSNIEALSAIAVQQSVTANNIANVNTDGFKASTATLETGPEGQGVQVQDIRQTSDPGPVLPSYQYGGPERGARDALPGHVEGSNTNLSREFVNLIKNENGYSANAVAVSAYEQQIGTILDMMG